ncbi:MAG: hypothetical protein HKN13_13955 [Rhodothermales bacterium]|nr:hypothetical protein [Rhodothermales bacterium]
MNGHVSFDIRSNRWQITALLVTLLWSVVPSSGHGQHCGRVGDTGGYLNARYGYSMSYDGGWHRLQISPTEDGFQLSCRDTLVVSGTVLDFRFADVEHARSYKDSLRIAATWKASLFCAADGPNGSSYCDEPSRVEDLSSDGRPVLLRFYQKFVREDFDEDEVVRTERQVGPYYAIDISQKGIPRFLLLTSGPHRDASEEYADALAAIVESIRVVDSPFLLR